MPNDRASVAPSISHDHIQIAADEQRPCESIAAVRRRCFDLLGEITTSIEQAAQQPEPLLQFEPRLISWVFALGRLLFQLFLTCAEARYEAMAPATVLRGQRIFCKRPRQPRRLGTFFGKVRYFRRYYGSEAGEGRYPLDEALGLTADGFTWSVVSLATRLATRMAFAAAAKTFAGFLGWAPATKTIEEWTLGLGEQGYAFQEQAPPPPDDGEVLIIQIDSKGIPTATEGELKKRKGRRRPNPHPESKRHRGRERRKHRAPRRRRKKGDKSKNARMATLVVMYTLKTVKDGDQVKQLGPLNLRILG